MEHESTRSQIVDVDRELFDHQSQVPHTVEEVAEEDESLTDVPDPVELQAVVDPTTRDRQTEG